MTQGQFREAGRSRRARAQNSTEQNPLHAYQAGRDYTVILEIEGPAGKARRSKVWGVSLK